MGVQTLGQEVAERLRRDLAEGIFKPGEKLPPERELMSRYSVGRNTVREAVRGLVALGMLEVKAGSGTTVSRVDGRTALARTMDERPMDESALEDLVEFRLLLEGQAAQLAAERATSEDLDRIRERLAAYQNAVRRYEAVYEHDVAFHRAVSEATHNRLFLDVIDTLAAVPESDASRRPRAGGHPQGCGGACDDRPPRTDGRCRGRRPGHARAHPHWQRAPAQGHGQGTARVAAGQPAPRRDHQPRQDPGARANRADVPAPRALEAHHQPPLNHGYQSCIVPSSSRLTGR